MGFQYAANRISSASDRSAASLLRAAATTDRRVTGKDSPGAFIAPKSLPYSQTLLVAPRLYIARKVRGTAKVAADCVLSGDWGERLLRRFDSFVDRGVPVEMRDRRLRRGLVEPQRLGRTIQVLE